MIMRRYRSSVLTFLGCAALAAACSQGSTQLSPAGPSTVLPNADTVSSGWTSATASTEPEFAVGDARGHRTVSGVGTVAHLQGSCNPQGTESYVSFVVQGVKVVTDVNTTYFIDAATDISGGCNNLRHGTKVRVVVGATPNADFSYTAQSITIVDQPGGKPPSPVQGEGVVAALKGGCPSLTMVIHGYPVMTTSSTTFTPDCSAITAGTRVKVTGVLGGNSVVAATVDVVQATQP
jgi:hypothetical protein